MGLSSRVTPREESCACDDGAIGSLGPNLAAAPLPRLSRLSKTGCSPSISDLRGDPFVASGGLVLPSGPGTSKLERLMAFKLPRLLRWRSEAVVGLVWMGKRVSGPPLLRSRRWPRGPGAGLVARLREALAFSSRALFRSSIKFFLLLSSVLIARGRFVVTEMVWLRVDMRLSSVKMGSLWAKRSRTSRLACFSSIVREVSVRGRRMHGAK